MKDKNSLIIYFSRADENWYGDGLKVLDKGNTEIAAEFVKEITKADMFKVEPTIPYPKTYEECKEESKKRFGKAPIKSKIENISDYDVIYVMTPVYFDSYAPEIETALKDLDFKGKIIRVITTHEGSGLGHVVADVMKVCNEKVFDALSIVGCEVNNSKNKIEKWIKDYN